MDEIRVLPVALLSPHLPTRSGLPPLALLWFAHIGFQQNVPMIAHSTPTGSPTSNRSTHGISRESHPYSTVSSPTPAPLLLHPQTLPFCNIQLTSSIQNLIISPIICTGHSMAVRQNNFLASLRDRSRALAVGVRRNIHYTTSSV